MNLMGVERLTQIQISDLKDQFETETGTSDAESDHEEAEFPFGMCKPASKHDILMALPTRPVVDRLVARYFSNEIAPSRHSYVFDSF